MEDPKGNIEKDIPEDKRVKNGPTKVMGCRTNVSEKAFTFDGRKWRRVEPSPDERLTVACYTPCGIRHAKKGRFMLSKRKVSCWVRPQALMLLQLCHVWRPQFRNIMRG